MNNFKIVHKEYNFTDKRCTLIYTQHFTKLKLLVFTFNRIKKNPQDKTIYRKELSKPVTCSWAQRGSKPVTCSWAQRGLKPVMCSWAQRGSKPVTCSWRKGVQNLSCVHGHKGV